MISLISLSENDKRLIIVLVIIFILIFIIAGYLGLLIRKIMKFQGERIDREVHDAVVTNVITEPKHFRRFGLKKNMRLLYKEARLPLLIFCLTTIAYIIYSMAVGHIVNVFDSEVEGFPTIMFLWDFASAPKVTFFGFTVISDWPPLSHTPTFHIEAIISYVVLPLFTVSIVWFLVMVQAYIARTFRLLKLSRSIYGKNLDNYNAATNTFVTPAPKQEDKKKKDESIIK